MSIFGYRLSSTASSAKRNTNSKQNLSLLSTIAVSSSSWRWHWRRPPWLSRGWKVCWTEVGSPVCHPEKFSSPTSSRSSWWCADKQRWYSSSWSWCSVSSARVILAGSSCSRYFRACAGCVSVSYSKIFYKCTNLSRSLRTVYVFFIKFVHLLPVIYRHYVKILILSA